MKALLWFAPKKAAIIAAVLATAILQDQQPTAKYMFTSADHTAELANGFPGSGFMLLETKSVVHVALLFGSTWIVNSIVFFAIPVMILASNLFVLFVRPKKLWPYYMLLVVSLGVNIVVTMSRFLALPGWERVAGSCAVVFVPIFYAGIVFATLFRDSSQPNVDFGSNIAGAILGGLCESLSLIIGFTYLLGFAILCYLLSAVSRRSPVPLTAGG